MNYTPLHYQIALTLLSGIGPIRAKELLLSVDNVGILFHDSPKELERRTRYNASFFRKLNRKEAISKADDIINYNRRNNINALFYTDSDYTDSDYRI